MAVHINVFFSFSYSLKVALVMVSVYIEPLPVVHFVVTKGLDAYT